MSYSYNTNVQNIPLELKDTEISVLSFGEDWPGVFISSEFAKTFGLELNESFVDKNHDKLKDVISNFHDVLDKSNVKNLDKENLRSLDDAGFRVNTGHIKFKNGLSGYFFRGDHSYMLKISLSSTLKDDDNSYTNIPFLINESKHWAK